MIKLTNMCKTEETAFYTCRKGNSSVKLSRWKPLRTTTARKTKLYKTGETTLYNIRVETQ